MRENGALARFGWTERAIATIVVGGTALLVFYQGLVGIPLVTRAELGRELTIVNTKLDAVEHEHQLLRDEVADIRERKKALEAQVNEIENQQVRVLEHLGLYQAPPPAPRPRPRP